MIHISDNIEDCDDLFDLVRRHQDLIQGLSEELSSALIYFQQEPTPRNREEVQKTRLALQNAQKEYEQTWDDSLTELGLT